MKTNNENKMQTTQVTIEGVAINIPVGSMDEPTQTVKDIVNAMQNQSNWKLATSAFKTMNLDMAEDVAYGLDWFMGGHEMNVDSDGYIVVTSKGYYHYIGA